MNGSSSNRAWQVKALALGMSALAFGACASAHKAALMQASAASAGSLAAGDFVRAVESYQKLYEKDRANGKVVSGYAAMLEDVKSAGDTARSKGSFMTAQGAYRVILDRWEGFSAIAPRLTFQRSDLEADLRDCRLAMCERQFRQELGAGSYVKALAIYQVALKDFPGDEAVKAACAKGLGEIKALGDKALAVKDYALAGKINGLLLKSYESMEGTAGAAAGRETSRQELEEALHACSSGLTNGGLAEYRKGNLESAIALWDELLSFDPGNAEIKKAVETAKAQLSKLKGSGRGSARSGLRAQGAH